MRRLFVAAAIGTLALLALLGWANAPTPSLSAGAKADMVVVSKSKHRMTLLRDGDPIASYPVSVGRGTVGPKQREGDRRTPEGDYVIDFHKRDSSFYRALHVSYPNGTDAARARRLGVSAGGSIMVHGLPPKLAFAGRLHRWIDWTDGCIALTNAEMQQVFDAVPDGTRIVIRP
jgi:murein L,D-transpeptidase YafK